MENDIIIGFKIFPRIYLTIYGEKISKCFEIDKIIEINEKDSWVIITYQEENGLYIQYTVEENYISILETIEKASNIKQKCLNLIKDNEYLEK